MSPPSGGSRGILLTVTLGRIPLFDAAVAVLALATAVVGWVATVDEPTAHRVIAAACFTVAALAVPVRRTAVTASAAATVAAFAVLAATGSADALGVFPLVLCVPLTLAAVVGHAVRRAAGVGVLVLSCLATPLSPAVTIAANRPLMIGLHVALLVVVYLWAGRRRVEREHMVADRERAVAEATADERQRIADDLHDGLGQALTAIRAASSTGLALARTRPEAALDALATVADLSRESLVELRRSVAEITDAASLGETLEQVRRAGREVRCRTPQDVDVDTVDDLPAPDAQDAVRRIAREALTNAVRHGASGGPITVDLCPTTTRGRVTGIRMRVDNEIGSAAGDDMPGRGCATMLRRAEAVGGRCSAARHGDRWVVDVQIPIGGPR
jgi:signal transduction histidine kinase